MSALPALVLFDLDGTLIDSAPDLAGAANAMREARGLPPLPVATLRPMVGSGARGMIALALDVVPGDVDYESLRSEFLDIYQQRSLDLTAVFSAVRPVLDRLEAHHRPWGIVTNKAERFTQPVVAALGLTTRAGAIVSGDTTAHPKPHPAPLLHAATLLGVAPGHCLYVGDDLRDITAGNAAGMHTIVAEYGYLGERGCADDWPATGWIERPLALLDWLPARRNP